jgi:general secretion pathway protein G
MRNHNTMTMKKAFTLVELLIVIIIIAVLAAIAIPKFTQSSQNSKIAAAKSDLKLYRNAVELFRADTGVYPAALADLAATAAPANGKDTAGAVAPITASEWKGPYIEAVGSDPSGNAYIYSVTSPTVGKVTAAAPYNGF